MEKAGANAKMDIDIKAHITNTTLKADLMITTMVRNLKHTGINPIREVINMYADYWKANYEKLYEAVTDTPKAVRLW
jgi:hypothetical protein